MFYMHTGLVIRRLHKQRLRSPFYLASFTWQRVALHSSVQVLSVAQDCMHMSKQHPPDVLNQVTKPWSGSEVQRQPHAVNFIFATSLEFSMKCGDFGLTLLKHLFLQLEFRDQMYTLNPAVSIFFAKFSPCVSQTIFLTVRCLSSCYVKNNYFPQFYFNYTNSSLKQGIAGYI